MRQCPLCSAQAVERFPTGLSRAMRSDGIILNEPLLKDACHNCGGLIGCNADPGMPYRRSDGTAPDEIARHEKIGSGLLAEIMALGCSGPILEVGAASFQTALHIANALPDSRVAALEPYPESLPDTDALDIHLVALKDAAFDHRFAVIYANHVMEHVPDPNGFLSQLAKLLEDDGRVILTCPSGLIPSHELLFSDHLFHFTPTAVAAAAAGSGLWLESSKPTPWEPLSQTFILARHPRPGLPPAADLWAARKAYLDRWADADDRMADALGDAPILFGAGEFSQLLRAYLPRLWAKIDVIVVDDLKGIRDFDKPVLRTAEVDLSGREVVLGLHPRSCATLTRRLLACGVGRVLHPIVTPAQ